MLTFFSFILSITPPPTFKKCSKFASVLIAKKVEQSPKNFATRTFFLKAAKAETFLDQTFQQKQIRALKVFDNEWVVAPSGQSQQGFESKAKRAY